MGCFRGNGDLYGSLLMRRRIRGGASGEMENSLVVSSEIDDSWNVFGEMENILADSDEIENMWGFYSNMDNSLFF